MGYKPKDTVIKIMPKKVFIKKVGKDFAKYYHTKKVRDHIGRHIVFRDPGLYDQPYNPDTVYCRTFGCSAPLSLLEQLSGNVCVDCMQRPVQDVTFSINS